jgi:asparagine synthase (glutamine-hydrolysing)
VFAVAHELASKGTLLAPALQGYTYSFGPGADPEVDELEYGRAVGEHLGVEIREIMPFMPDLDWFLERGRADRDMAPYPNAAMATNIGRAAIEQGSRVVLNGEGGDEFLTGNPYYYGDQLAEGDRRGLAASFREDLAAFGLGQTLAKLFRYGVGPNVPVPLRTIRRRWRRGLLHDVYGLDFGWLSAELRARLRDRSKVMDQALLDSIRSGAQRGLYMALTEGFLGYAHDYLGRNAARVGYELRSPLYDRRLIEFAFAIPASQRMRGGVRKHIHVRAFAGDLPDKVLNRRTDVRFNLPFERLLDSDKFPVLGELLQRGMNFVNHAGLKNLRDCLAHRPSGARPIYELWAVVGCLNLFGDR